jgi:hypothetical protein
MFLLLRETGETEKCLTKCKIKMTLIGPLHAKEYSGNDFDTGNYRNHPVCTAVKDA